MQIKRLYRIIYRNNRYINNITFNYWHFAIESKFKCRHNIQLPEIDNIYMYNFKSITENIK